MTVQDPLSVERQAAGALRRDNVAQDGATREERRSRAKRRVRGRTIDCKRMTKGELELGRMLYPPTRDRRPKTRGECVGGERPCPFVSCRHHLYVDVSPRTGSIMLNFPDLEPWELGESCVLDVADRGVTTLEQAGAVMNITRERVRQIEVQALDRAEAERNNQYLRDYVDEGSGGKRRLPIIRADEDLDDGDGAE